MRTTLAKAGMSAMLSEASETAIRSVTPEVAADAKRIAAVRTGGLMDSIGYFFEGEGTEIVGLVGSDADHVDPEGVRVGNRGFFVEKGISGPAQPWLRPALYQNRAIR